MSKPLIGVTVGHYFIAQPFARRPVDTHGCPTTYVTELQRAGGAPTLLPPSRDNSLTTAIVERLDALLLTGGVDVSPPNMNAQPHPNLGMVDHWRDIAEITATRVAMERGIPILAICRGIQLLNVALGGTLIQHLDDERPGAICHDVGSATSCPTHSIEIAPGSLMERLVGEGTQWVNTYHHQALDRVADGFVVTARSVDGVIEAIEDVGTGGGADGVRVLAVQFHPERLAEEFLNFRNIFTWLVNKA